MNRVRTFALITCSTLACITGSLAIAGGTADVAKNGAKTMDMPLPKGMTPEQMQACMEAGIPGKMHEYLAKGAGTWAGKSIMKMTADSEPMNSECTLTVTPIMDGRFVKTEMVGEMPGMGPISGLGITGFDNVSKKFQCTWADSCSTGMMQGTGELSSDGSTMTMTYTANCPVTKKPVAFREIQRRTGDNTMTLEMHGPDMVTGKEFKMMEIAFTRTAAKPSPISAR